MAVDDDANNTMDALFAANSIVKGASEVFLDEKVKSGIAQHQPGSEIQAIEGHGASFWTRTARVGTTLNGESSLSYFLKMSSSDDAEQMMRGEFASQKAMYRYIPNMVPKPIIYGQYVSDPKMYFYLCVFVEMTEEIPRPPKFCASLASLHLQSMEDSPGKYGYDFPTTQGNIPLDNTWCDSWTLFFAKAMDYMIKREAKTQGSSTKIEELRPALINKVIPRLLRPLETGEERIKPCLVHGDLWHGNTSVSVESSEPYVFDSCVLWAHNEYDLGMWRARRYKFGRSYVREYQKHVPISAPVGDWDDRNALYAIRVDLLCSALYSSNQNFRQLAVIAMQRLVDKYPEGYEGSQS